MAVSSSIEQAFQVLGAQPREPLNGVTKKYRKLALLNHPDKVGEGSVIRMQQINAAFDAIKEYLACHRDLTTDNDEAAGDAETPRRPAPARHQTLAPDPSPEPAPEPTSTPRPSQNYQPERGCHVGRLNYDPKRDMSFLFSEPRRDPLWENLLRRPVPKKPAPEPFVFCRWSPGPGIPWTCFHAHGAEPGITWPTEVDKDPYNQMQAISCYFFNPEIDGYKIPWTELTQLFPGICIHPDELQTLIGGRYFLKEKLENRELEVYVYRERKRSCKHRQPKFGFLDYLFTWVFWFVSLAWGRKAVHGTR